MIFQMSQEEEVLVLLLEHSDSDGGGGSSVEADEAWLSVVWEGEGLVVAEATRPRQSERPAGAEAPGSNMEKVPPGPRARTRAEVGMGRADWSAVAGRLCVMRRQLVRVETVRSLSRGSRGHAKLR